MTIILRYPKESLKIDNFVYSNAFSYCIHEQMQSHTDCICVFFLQCVFSYESSNWLPKWMQSHTDCICLTFPRYSFSNEPSKCVHKRKHNYTVCICLISSYFLSLFFRWYQIYSGHHFQDLFPSMLGGRKEIDVIPQHY